MQTIGGSIHLLDAENLTPVAEPLAGQPAYPGLITDHPLAFGPDGETLVVGLSTGAQLWDLSTGAAIGGLFPNDGLFAASPAFDGRHVRHGPRRSHVHLGSRHRCLARPGLSGGRPQHDTRRMAPIRTGQRAIPGHLPPTVSARLNHATDHDDRCHRPNPPVATDNTIASDIVR